MLSENRQSYICRDDPDYEHMLKFMEIFRKYVGPAYPGDYRYSLK